MNGRPGGGTRFRLFPQAPFDGTVAPEIVHVLAPPASIGAGPADARMYLVDPIGKQAPYGVNLGPYGSPYLFFPPWLGPAEPPAVPDAAGHFDHLEPGMPAFEAAHAFGCIRFALDVWEGYFGREVAWHFRQDYDRLEIVLLPHYDNAQAGYGFLEIGSYFIEGRPLPFTVNFDILAHEVGHLIVSAEVGTPDMDSATSEYLGFQEAAADLTALVASAHFASVTDQLLDQTAGNLYVLNKLNRIGELSDNQQIRLASNDVPLWAFSAGWSDEHDLSLPLTGAVFDILVDVFHELLVAHRLISPEMEDLADVAELQPEQEPLLQALFERAYAVDPGGFCEALLAARGLVGAYLAEAWTRLSPEGLSYARVANVLVGVDHDLSDGRYHRLIRRNFDLRGIGRATVGPRLAPPSPQSHAFSARTIVPDFATRLPRMSYRERWLLAHARDD